MAVLSKTTCQFSRKRNGYDSINKEELKEVAFDYLIDVLENEGTI